MKKSVFAVMFVIAMLVSGLAYAVSITIDIPLPRIVITAPPALVVIPGTYVYLAPDIETDLFFFDGKWYRLYGGTWYVGLKYMGPWVILPGPKVPPALLRLPPGYRKLPPGHARIKHDEAMKNWRKWKNDRHWDKPAAQPPSADVKSAPAAATTPKSDDKGKAKGKAKDDKDN